MFHYWGLNKLVLSLYLLILGCSVSDSGEYHETISFVSCSWKIPSSFQLIGRKNSEYFHFTEEILIDGLSYNLSSISFNGGGRRISDKEFEYLQNVYGNFQLSETADYLLLKYKVLIRDQNGDVISEGSNIIILEEKRTGNSVVASNVDIKQLISDCEIPEI